LIPTAAAYSQRGLRFSPPGYHGGRLATPYLHASSHSDSFVPIVTLEPFIDITAIAMRESPIYQLVDLH